jgi:hypothetical protein
MISYCTNRATISLSERNLVAWFVYDSTALYTSILGRSERKCTDLVLKTCGKKNRADKIMDNFYITLFVMQVGRCHKLRKPQHSSVRKAGVLA